MNAVGDQFAVQTIANKEFQPIIRNPDSKFVVITYWWGRGKPNKNTQRPCPYEVEESIDEEIEAALLEDSGSFREISRVYVPLKKQIVAGDKARIQHSPEALRAWRNIKHLRNQMLKNYKESEEMKPTYLRLRDNVVESILNKPTYAVKTPVKWHALSRRARTVRRQIRYERDSRGRFLYEAEEHPPEPPEEQEGGVRRRQTTRRTPIKWCRRPERRTQRPMLFDEMLQQWNDMCESMNVNSLSVEYPEFTQDWPKYYQSA